MAGTASRFTCRSTRRLYSPRRNSAPTSHFGNESPPVGRRPSWSAKQRSGARVAGHDQDDVAAGAFPDDDRRESAGQLDYLADAERTIVEWLHRLGPHPLRSEQRVLTQIELARLVAAALGSKLTRRLAVDRLARDACHSDGAAVAAGSDGVPVPERYGGGAVVTARRHRVVVAEDCGGAAAVPARRDSVAVGVPRLGAAAVAARGHRVVAAVRREGVAAVAARRDSVAVPGNDVGAAAGAARRHSVVVAEGGGGAAAVADRRDGVTAAEPYVRAAAVAE